MNCAMNKFEFCCKNRFLVVRGRMKLYAEVENHVNLQK